MIWITSQLVKNTIYLNTRGLQSNLFLMLLAIHTALPHEVILTCRNKFLRYYLPCTVIILSNTHSKYISI